MPTVSAGLYTLSKIIVGLLPPNNSAVEGHRHARTGVQTSSDHRQADAAGLPVFAP